MTGGLLLFQGALSGACEVDCAAVLACHRWTVLLLQDACQVNCVVVSQCNKWVVLLFQGATCRICCCFEVQHVGFVAVGFVAVSRCCMWNW